MRIGFFGKMGSGKTTASKFLNLARGFRKESLASTLKEIAELREEERYLREGKLHEYAFELLPDPVYAQAFLTYNHPLYGSFAATPVSALVRLWQSDLSNSEDLRELYQRLGTDSGRFIKPAIWIDHFARNLQDGDVVVDDIRFVNEGEALKKLGFLNVKLVVPEEVRIERLLERDGEFVAGRQQHSSETELEEIVPDILIYNTGDTKDLYEIIQDVIDKFGHGLYTPGMEAINYHPGGVVGPVTV